MLLRDIVAQHKRMLTLSGALHGCIDLHGSCVRCWPSHPLLDNIPTNSIHAKLYRNWYPAFSINCKLPTMVLQHDMILYTQNGTTSYHVITKHTNFFNKGLPIIWLRIYSYMLCYWVIGVTQKLLPLILCARLMVKLESKFYCCYLSLHARLQILVEGYKAN